MSITLFFGGTFNPPHTAHRKMLETVCALKEIERVIVAPTNIPPHKDVPTLFADNEQRLNMCRLLCEGLDKAKASDIEFRREGKSFSFYTLSDLKKQYENIAMLIGGDMVTSFTAWYNYQGILEIAELYAVRRRGIDNEEFDRSIENLRAMGGKITVIDTKLPKVSSTEIRNRIASGCVDLEGSVPQNICKYIFENNIYSEA